MAPALRQVQRLRKFKPEMPLRYNGAMDPLVFLLGKRKPSSRPGAMIGGWPTGFPWPSPAFHACGCSTYRRLL